MMNNIDKKIQRLQEQIGKLSYNLDTYSTISGDIEAIGRNIERVAKEIDELKKEAEKQSNNLYWQEFNNGDYVMLTGDLMRVEEATASAVSICNLEGAKMITNPYRLRIANTKEIEQALRSEWDRRCKEAGWASGDEAEIEVDGDGNCDWYRKNDGDWGNKYLPEFDSMSNKNGIVYDNGKWATPKTKKVDTFFAWDVTDNGDRVKIGCKTYDKQFIVDLYYALGELKPYTHVANIMFELNHIECIDL